MTDFSIERMSSRCDNGELKKKLASGYTHFDKFAFTGASNTLVFLAGLFKATELEYELLFTIAHEMVHYYKAHMIWDPDRHSYFFQQKPYLTAKTPKPDRTLKKLGRQLESLGDLDNKGILLPGAKFHQAIYGIIGRIYDDSAQARKLDSACGRAKTIYFSDDFSTFRKPPEAQIASIRPRGSLPKKMAGTLRSFERSLEDCARKVTIVDSHSHGTNQVGPGDVSLSPDFFESCTEPKNRKGNLLTYISAVNESLLKQKCDWLSLIEKATDLKLGRYTIEQQADEHAWEIISWLGIPWTYGLKSIHRMAEIRGGKENARCAAWLTRQTGLRKYRRIPVHVDFNIHHSACFRADNLKNEARAHGYSRFSNSATAKPPKDGPSWKAFKDAVSDLIDK